MRGRSVGMICPFARPARTDRVPRASRGSGGNRERLARELDRLKGLGVTHIRVLASGEGESCMIPAITTKPGVYSASLLEGLDYFLAELAKRDMVATLILNNGLPWSGGMSAYVEWVTQSRSPFAETHSWDSATHYEHATRFFKLDAAMKLFEDYIRMLVSRVNTVTGSTYSKDPTIMAWEIANEPRIGGRNLDAAYEPWVRRVAELLKSLDPNHLVTLGSDGTGGVYHSMRSITPAISTSRPFMSGQRNSTGIERKRTPTHHSRLRMPSSVWRHLSASTSRGQRH